MNSRYTKPVGWRGESHRHYLAAKGIKTRYNSSKYENYDPDFPIKNLMANDSELQAIAEGVAPKVYQYRYGTTEIPEKHRQDADVELTVRRLMKEQREKAAESRTYQASKVKYCLACNTEYAVGLHLRTPRCPNCGFSGGLMRDAQSTEGLPDAVYAKKVDFDEEKHRKWQKLVNMSPSELEKFKQSAEGKEAGLTKSEARAEGIKSGHESAEAILRMKRKPFSEWTDADKRWANRQISFISRMRGVQGPLYRDGEPTRKLTSLKIWGHDPMKNRAYAASKVDLNKYAGTWRQKDVSPEPFYQRGLTKVTATYTPRKDGTIKVVNTGVTKDGKKKRIVGTAKPVTPDNRELEVTFGKSPIARFLMRGSYKIVKVDPQYKHATVKGGDGTIWHLVR